MRLLGIAALTLLIWGSLIGFSKILRTRDDRTTSWSTSGTHWDIGPVPTGFTGSFLEVHLDVDRRQKALKP